MLDIIISICDRKRRDGEPNRWLATVAQSIEGIETPAFYFILSSIIQKGPYRGPCLDHVKTGYPRPSTFLSYATLLLVIVLSLDPGLL